MAMFLAIGGAAALPKPSALAFHGVRRELSVPQIPDQFYAEIHGNTTGTLPGIPYGTAVIKQWYDYQNKRLRKDLDDGTTKLYRYDQLVDPGLAPHPRFPSPQGFRYRTDDIENSCCWLWLIDADTEQPDRMEKFEVEKNAVDVGPTPIGEHWSSVSKFPFLQTDDWWFKNGTLSSSNSYFEIPTQGNVMSNGTFQNVVYGDIPETIFDHPDSRPTFGKCKQCGVDDECPMWQCTS